MAAARAIRQSTADNVYMRAIIVSSNGVSSVADRLAAASGGRRKVDYPATHPFRMLIISELTENVLQISATRTEPKEGGC